MKKASNRKQVPLKLADIADLLGITERHVYRLLQKGIVRRSDGGYAVDLKAYRRIVKGDEGKKVKLADHPTRDIKELEEALRMTLKDMFTGGMEISK